ncbi:MAG: hypothetical protein WAP08_03135 [Smithellaceae bacterium]|jgi:hypothetical protein|nr:hypothetical protein [Smithellaceae bacterium]
MGDIAAALGNFIIRVLDSDVVTEAIEWAGVERVGYGVIIIIIAVVLLIVFARRRG